MGKKSKVSKPALSGMRVKKLSSDKPEARDEGPRLLPLGDGRKPTDPIFPSSIQRAIDLADIALGNKKPKPRP